MPRTLALLAAISCALIPAAAARAALIAVDGPTDELTENSYCSLREAIQAAIDEDPLWSVAHGCVPGDGVDVIYLPTGRYQLSLGELDISGEEDLLTIMPLDPNAGGEDVVLDALDAHRVARITTNTGDVFVERVTFTNGMNVDGADPRGGALLVEVAKVTLTDCVVENSSARKGGGAYLWEAVLHLDRTTFTGNYADAVSGTALHGGGIYADNAILYLTNSTMSGNSARYDGGSLYLDEGATAWLRHTTVTGSSCGWYTTNDGDGGGVMVLAGASLNLAHSIVADNQDLSSFGTDNPDCGGQSTSLTSHGFNLVGNSSGCAIAALPSDRFGTAASPIPALLGGLERNPSGTLVRVPLPSSLTVDGGYMFTGSSFSLCDPLDQSHQSRPVDGDNNLFANCDIGAVEMWCLFCDGLATGDVGAWDSTQP